MTNDSFEYFRTRNEELEKQNRELQTHNQSLLRQRRELLIEKRDLITRPIFDEAGIPEVQRVKLLNVMFERGYTFAKDTGDNDE